jgi:large subunit ribosomal protein L18
MKLVGRERRHKRITKRLKGDEHQPRLVVFRSKKHIYAQLINDKEQRVITSSSTLDKEFLNAKLKDNNIKSSNKKGAKKVGELIAHRALELKVKRIKFDRAGYKYHGRVKELAEGARELGLEF